MPRVPGSPAPGPASDPGLRTPRPMSGHRGGSLQLGFCLKYPSLVQVQTSLGIKVRQKCTPRSKLAQHVLSWGWRFIGRGGPRERDAGVGADRGDGATHPERQRLPCRPSPCVCVLGRRRVQGVLPSVDGGPRRPGVQEAPGRSSRRAWPCASASRCTTAAPWPWYSWSSRSCGNSASSRASPACPPRCGPCSSG